MIDMRPVLSKSYANRLLKELIREDRKTNQNLKEPELFYKHLSEASDLSYKVGCVLCYQGINVDVELTQVSALFHDIGKVVATPLEREKDPKLIFDSIHGERYLKKIGLPEIADVIRPSFTTYELIKLKPNLFPEIKPHDLIPKTPEQETVVYVDIHTPGRPTSVGSWYVSFNERMKYMRETYGENSLIVQSFDIGGEERLRRLNYKIEKKIGLLI